MSRKVLLETGYTFTPGGTGSGTIVIPRSVPRERLVLITNVTKNQVIYNFSDPNLKANTYTVTSTGASSTTILTLNYNTSSMSSSDKLQITIDEYEEKFSPAEIFQDPVNKFRTSQPQALIDTDFEYGTQLSKWENLAMINNRPFVFSSPVGVGTINSITMNTGSKIVTVQLANVGPGIGSAITVQDSILSVANGNFLVENIGGGGTIFTYTAKSQNSTLITNILDPNKTGIFSGSTYSNARIGSSPANIQVDTVGLAVTVITSNQHGLSIGNEVAIAGITGTNPPNGTFIISSITNPTSFTFYSTALASGLNFSNASIFVSPSAQFLHRPFDGGILFSTNGSSNFEQAIRQTRRYFRYQSGKGIQVSSGTCLKPNIQIDAITASGVSAGSTITVQTKDIHNIQFVSPGTQIVISGVNEAGYNGTFTVSGVTGYNKVSYASTVGLSTTKASGTYNMSISNWYGAANRLGIFDQQNGLFFEYDGQTLYAVRRNSTYQLSGKVSVVNNSNTLVQTDPSFPTSFSAQINVGDYIVLRGQSYRVIDIISDIQLTISPAYRAASANFVIPSKTIDTRIPQSSWNLDRCDGTGPSGYNIDLTKMQMFYIDYSWYGAGFVRWGVRGQNGDVIYVHKLANNNVNTEAYMRSGNLPGRYETSTIPPATYLTSSVGTSDTTISVGSTSNFPPRGTLVIRDTVKYEYVNYTGVSGNTFTGLTRAQSGGVTAVSIAQSSIVATASTANLQIGQKVISTAIPEGAYIADITPGTLVFSQAATSTLSGVAVTFAPMGVTTAQTFSYSATAPVPVELAFPTFAPSISHWGTSVIMDGRFDDDKSLVFTYGQTGSTSLAAAGTLGSTRALLAIRVAPSVDQGIVAAFGQRELINRMQLVLRTLDLTSLTAGSNILVRAFLNSTPTTAATWTNAVGNVFGAQNSSLAQIADYVNLGGATGVQVSGGEVIAGFFVGTGANSIDLSSVRDLGNCILGGGGATSATNVYPDGPDTLTIIATNLTSTPTNVATRISWTEAQA
jgi:hypothetical protein